MFKASDIEQSHYPVHKSSKQKQLVFPQFVVEPADRIEKEIKAIRTPLEKNGMDFGFVTSYNAALWMVVDHDHKIRFRMKACKKFKGSRAMYTKKVKDFINKFRKGVKAGMAAIKQSNTVDDVEDGGMDTLTPQMDITALREHYEQLKRDIIEDGAGG